MRRDVTGLRFGMLTAIERIHTNEAQSRWICRCDCGNAKLVTLTNLRKATSCGCRRGERHGLTYSPEWRVWQSMITRCHTPSATSYPRYGARGVTVCERWRRSFRDFLSDVGSKPSSGHSLDRIENDRGYEPGNVRWATRKEQERNKRSNHLVEWNGEQITIAEAAERLGVGYDWLHGRIRRGLTLEVIRGS